LRAQFWTNTDFVGDPFTACVMPQAGLNLGFFNFPGFGAASPRVPALPFELTGRISVRFSGRIVVPVEGEYRLSVTLLGSAKIWLDDQLVLDFRYHGPGRSGGGGAASGAWAGFAADDDVRVPRVGDEAQPADQRAADVGLNATAPAPPLPPMAGSGGEAGPAPDVTSFGLHLDKRAGGHSLRIDYAADAPAQGHLTGAQFRLGWVPPPGVVSQHIEEAVARARGADLAVVAVRCYESEHMDRPDLRLPNGQAALIRAVAAVNPNTVVITMSGGPVETLSWEQDVRAILHAGYLGQEQGTALAAMLFGDVVPSGKLPLSFPRSDAEGLFRSAAQYPGIDGRVVYEEGTQVGYRGFDALALAPRFAFGHGLSYTTFEYGALEIVSADGLVTVSCTIANSGSRAGMETAQLYVGLTADGAAPRQLIDWQKLALEPGERRRIAFRIDPSSIERPFSTWQDGQWQLARGPAKLFVGASSRDLRLEGAVTL
jgi:beta-glucosidase